jgi:ABC-type sugar transport system substrate-binding protein
VQLADVTDFRRDHAREAARHAIEHWGDRIAGVWCDSGLNGAGSLQAFADAGFDPGRTPPHTGGDLNLAYKLAVQRRVKLASVDYPPAMGIRAFDLLLASLRGEWVPRDVDVPCHLVVSQGAATPSIRPRAWAEHRVRWDMPDDLVFGAGLGPHYNPQAFRVSYPGNSYNRSAIDRFRGVA